MNLEHCSKAYTDRPISLSSVHHNKIHAHDMITIRSVATSIAPNDKVGSTYVVSHNAYGNNILQASNQFHIIMNIPQPN